MEKYKHITKTEIEDHYVNVYSVHARSYSELITVNVDIDDRDEAVSILEKYGYEIGYVEESVDHSTDEPFARIKAVVDW